ncbi:MAG TPA: tRNA (N6-isopentenyl adenosine(37)-C2)-methylthiotransferase MiaB [bacterium]|nr:tRNA (N6-isopentenyl adenosine(37)-C2)-methylthiotransferase MiaB [bacterium]
MNNHSIFKFKIFVFGCQMNKNDAERATTFLQSLGGQPADDENEADLMVVLACSVRQSAVDRLYGLARKWRLRSNPPVLLLSGCLHEKDQEKFLKKYDLVLSIEDLPRWGNELASYFSIQEYLQTQSEQGDYFAINPDSQKKYSVFVPIMTGCNNFCSYCIVPYTRGRERSRPVAEVLAEVKQAIKDGAKEIIFLGQNVNSYAPADSETFSVENPYKQSAFAKLLWEANRLPGLERMYFTASHPKDMSDEVIDALGLKKHLNYLHLPLQSGSDTVLQRMNRKYTVADYLKIVEKVRQVRPNIALGTDFIIGFCGETEAEFQETLDTYKKIKFDISYHSKYSQRRGTVAAKTMKDDVPLDLKKERWFRIQHLMEAITNEKNKQYQDQVLSVLFDAYDEKKQLLSGQSRELKLVFAEGGSADDVGKIYDVKIDKTSTWALWGKIIK